MLRKNLGAAETRRAQSYFGMSGEKQDESICHTVPGIAYGITPAAAPSSA
jgi:hypothetical protein